MLFTWTLQVKFHYMFAPHTWHWQKTRMKKIRGQNEPLGLKNPNALEM